MKLEIVPIHKTVQVVEMDNKPPMALAMENPKLRDYPLEVRNKNTHALVSYLLNLLGVSSGKIEHHAATFEFINSMYLNYTYQELQLAFQKFVAGEFPGKVFKELNPVVVGRVMGEYEALRKDALNRYYRERAKAEVEVVIEIDQEEKDNLFKNNVLRVFSEYKEKGYVSEPVGHIYEHFYDNGCLPKHTEKYRSEIKKRAISEMKKAHKINPEKPESFAKFLDRITTTEKGKLSAKCREIILTDYFDLLITNEKDIQV